MRNVGLLTAEAELPTDAVSWQKMLDAENPDFTCGVCGWYVIVM